MIQKKNDKQYLQNTTQKTNNRATRTPLKTRLNPGDLDGQAVPVPLVAPFVLLLLNHS
jgi:hypothetical protein